MPPVSFYPQQEFERMKSTELTHPWYLNLDALVQDSLQKTIPASSDTVKFLDIGCGTGRLLKKISMQFPQWQLLGMDFSPWAVSHTQTLGFSAEIRLGSADSLPYEDAQFDVAACLDVLYLESLSDAQAVHEIFRVLKPGGIAVVNVPALEALTGAHSRLVQTKKRYHQKQLQHLFADEGFHILKLTYWNFFLLPALFLLRRFPKKNSSEQGSDLEIKIPAFLQAFLNGIYAVERGCLKFFSLPIGSSLFLIAQKPKFNPNGI